MTEAAPGKLTRQQIYDRIRESSKDEYILSEMKRLGFWPKQDEKPTAAEEAIKRQGQLEAELRQLSQRLRLAEDPEAALRAMRKERMLESRKKQEENRRRRNQDRYEKAAAWHARQDTQIDYLGEGVSAGLADVGSDAASLEKNRLPVLHSAADLAAAMGISVRELRFLSFSRKVSRVHHYRQFEIRKKTGGTRRISAPMPRLKRAQYWILDNVFNKLETHSAAHGFVSGRSIVSNAVPHVGSAVVINLDLQDFFPTISYRRVKGLVKSFGYSEQLATVIALLTTEPNADVVELHGERYYVANGERRLPQGSPASPAVSNIICRRLDRRLRDMAAKLGFVYTRYADDMTFSAPDKRQVEHLNKLLWRARAIISDEGFTLHPDKTRIMRAGARQEVTGIVVNAKPSLERKTLRRFRAALHRLEKDGANGVEWNGADNVLESMAGFANYLAMVDPTKGADYQKRMTKLRRQHKTAPAALPGELNNRRLRVAAARGEAAKSDWWQPAQRPPPVLEKTPGQLKDEKREQRRAQRAAAQPAPAPAAAESAGSESHIDVKTGRFRPSLLHSFFLLSIFTGVSLLTGRYALLFFGAAWVVVGHLAWRLHMLWRVLITFGVLVAASGLVTKLLSGG